MDRGSTPPPECPGCRSTSFSANRDGVPSWLYCGAPRASVGRCPRCGTPSEPNALSCPVCGTVLVRKCPSCATLNPVDAQRCLVCGRGLNIADAVFTRLTTKTPKRLRQVRQTGDRIKTEEERASQARLAHMWTADETHRAE